MRSEDFDLREADDEELIAELRSRPALLFKLLSEKPKTASPWFDHWNSAHAKRTRAMHMGMVRVAPGREGEVVAVVSLSVQLYEPFAGDERYGGEDFFDEERFEEAMVAYRADLLLFKPYTAYVYVNEPECRKIYVDTKEEGMKRADEELEKKGWILG